MRKCKHKDSIYFTHPSLCMNWDYEKNDEIGVYPDKCSRGSEKKVWWMCGRGHSWGANINRIINGGSCPYCSGRYACEDNCVATTNPELLIEWDYQKNFPLTPYNTTHGILKKVWWKCEKGHSWLVGINNRIKGNNCPYCSRHFVDKKDSIVFTNPELLKEWNYEKNVKLNPENLAYGTQKKVWWKCKNNHEWIAPISNRASKHNKNGCPYCKGKMVCDDNCLATKNPKLSKEWDYEKNDLTPADVTECSSKKVWWKCKNNHSWAALVYSRNNGNGCPFCSKIELLDGQCVDSLIEAWYYLLLRDNGIKFELNKKYNNSNLGFGQHRFDFYIPEINTYIEVTSFLENMKHKKFSIVKYLKNIVKKKRLVISNGANFQFIQKNLNRAEKRYVFENIK